MSHQWRHGIAHRADQAVMPAGPAEVPLVCRVISLRPRKLSSELVDKGLRDVPVIPELRFAPRLTRPGRPGRAVGIRAAESGLPVRRPAFDRDMLGPEAEVSVTDWPH